MQNIEIIFRKKERIESPLAQIVLNETKRLDLSHCILILLKIIMTKLTIVRWW